MILRKCGSFMIFVVPNPLVNISFSLIDSISVLITFFHSSRSALDNASGLCPLTELTHIP